MPTAPCFLHRLLFFAFLKGKNRLCCCVISIIRRLSKTVAATSFTSRDLFCFLLCPSTSRFLRRPPPLLVYFTLFFRFCLFRSRMSWERRLSRVAFGMAYRARKTGHSGSYRISDCVTQNDDVLLCVTLLWYRTVIKRV